ncbi:MAG TPA: hypothetical protein VNU68_04940 [Verrucomicrobiae bacterium]|nr:hypothetical protein [Verrucomicrobiae bacterium]
MITVCLSFIIGIVVLSCLSLVRSQNQAVARSQAWNTCIPVIEAGLEEAMAHLNNQRELSLVANGWQPIGSQLARERAYGDGFYSVRIDINDLFRPTIVCTGYVRLPAVVAQANQPLLAAAALNVGGVAYIARAVQVVAKKDVVFSKAMLAKERINLSGNNITTDSFDSTDPTASTGTLYDPAKARDNGDVATNSGLTNSIGSGNANIKGHLSTGPSGTVGVGANGVVGSLAWHAGGNSGIEPGWARDDMNMWLPDVVRPFNGGGFFPASGTITGAVYKYVLPGGNFEMPQLTVKAGEKIAVTGDSVLLVDGDVDMLGKVDIMPGASLRLYVAGASANFGGSGINNTGRATNFVYYGLPSNTSLTLPSSGDFTGAIYAPSVDFKLNGGGSAVLHFVGACVTKTIHVTGHYAFHYDESLRSYGPWKDYVIISWVEL